MRSRVLHGKVLRNPAAPADAHDIDFVQLPALSSSSEAAVQLIVKGLYGTTGSGDSPTAGHVEHDEGDARTFRSAKGSQSLDIGANAVEEQDRGDARLRLIEPPRRSP